MSSMEIPFIVALMFELVGISVAVGITYGIFKTRMGHLEQAFRDYKLEKQEEIAQLWQHFNSHIEASTKVREDLAGIKSTMDANSKNIFRQLDVLFERLNELRK